jgi:predicted ABC-class ATPase
LLPADSILPRESGVSDRPMAGSSAFRFVSPKELETSFELPNEVTWHGHRTKTIHGMGIHCGVTVLTGGGFHGKSTLLQAISNGIFPHIHGDGREYVVSNPACVKIRAEDGRRVEKVDISGFITDLPHGRPTDGFITDLPHGRPTDGFITDLPHGRPHGRPTDVFSSDNASGSTSQAANIVEAIEVGAKCLLLDEDTCATNFMVRDARMQILISKSMEPITPYVDRVRELYDSFSISTILVVGGNSDYFEHAGAFPSHSSFHLSL